MGDVIYGHWGEVVARAMLNMLSPKGYILMVASEERRGSVNGFTDYLTKKEDFHILKKGLTSPFSKNGIFTRYLCFKRLSNIPDAVLQDQAEQPYSLARIETAQ